MLHIKSKKRSLTKTLALRPVLCTEGGDLFHSEKINSLFNPRTSGVLKTAFVKCL